MEILEERFTSSRARSVPRGLKRKFNRFPLRPRGRQPTTRRDYTPTILK
jgi:hypothetical protein